jgi:hypothetical protein
MTTEEYQGGTPHCHTCMTNNGKLQPNDEVATSLAYEYNNPSTSHVPKTISSTYTTTLLLAFTKDFNT